MRFVDSGQDESPGFFSSRCFCPEVCLSLCAWSGMRGIPYECTWHIPFVTRYFGESCARKPLACAASMYLQLGT